LFAETEKNYVSITQKMGLFCRLWISWATGLGHLRSKVTFALISLKKDSQIVIPRLPRKFRQDLIAHHSSCTPNAVSASVRWHLLVSNLSQCHIKSGPLFYGPSSTLTYRFFDNSKYVCVWPSGRSDIILDTVEINFLSSRWPSNQGQREIFGTMEWENLPMSYRVIILNKQKK
jgi:hypothetical protein